MKPLEQWLEYELCATAPCDAVTVTAAYTAVTDSCSKELEKQRWIPMAAQAALLVSASLQTISAIFHTCVSKYEHRHGGLTVFRLDRTMKLAVKPSA